MKSVLISIFLIFQLAVLGQEVSNEFTFEEYLAFVKKNHPLAKQANLKLSEAQAYLLKARGGFDPKIEADYTSKQYGDKDYYSIFNGSFKVPTWYGIELKAAFDNNEGIFLNPENTTPNSGLTSLGISVPIGQGLWINERMADLKKAKQYQNLNTAERNLMLTEVLYKASLSYFEWKKNYSEVLLYENYLKNARERYDDILISIQEGDKAAIDSVETGISLKNRQLNLENAKLKLIKSRLELSNFLWTENGVPLELETNLYPEVQIENSILSTLNLNDFTTASIENHPKINALNSKLSILTIDKKLKANSLLPKMNVNYNYLSEPSAFDNYRFEDYKIGASFSFPLFLRKERAELKLAKLQLIDTELSIAFEKQNLTAKIEAQKSEITSFKKQQTITENLVSSYNQMLAAEERLFALGDSSVFLINSRENNLVNAQLAQLSLQNQYYTAMANLFKTIANITD